jgi:hypothetical protein
MEKLIHDIVKIKVKDLKNWDKNPREITSSQFEGLKQLIKKFGFIGTLKVDKDTYEVLGGNMRLKAARDLAVDELNCELIDIHSIAFDNEQSYDDAKLEVALTDNNQFGYYVKDQLLALIITDTKIDLDLMKIDINPMSINDIISLDGLDINTSVEQGPEQHSDQKSETCNLIFMVTQEQKSVILRKLHEIKDEMLLEKDGDALYELCNDD